MYLSLCAIAKNETLYLEEWINFHRAVGIEHFYIYDNESDIPIKETLKAYIDAGIVTVIDFPGRGKQMPAYDHCLQHYGKDSKWMAFYDVDEFLIPKIADTVPEILKEYEAFGGLNVSWVIFGSGGKIEKPEGLLIENFTMSSQRDWYENTHTKAIVQTERTLRAGCDPHHCVYKPGFFSVSEDYKVVPYAWTPNCAHKLQLNHYFLKSLEEFKVKIQRPRADIANPNAQGRQLKDFYDFDKYCTIPDDCAIRFIEKTKSLYLK